MSGAEQAVVLSRRDDGVAILALGDESERVVTLNESRMESLEQALSDLESNVPKGLVICGPNREMFTAGADIHAIKDITDEPLAEKLARKGQLLFQRIADLSCTTVAAISGPCVGGGCELSLACDYRVATDEPSTTVGLPETKLGIVPGFGGTQRLPRLIGLPQALDIILAGKTLKPSQALKKGLVDSVVSYEKLMSLAAEVALGSKKLPRKGISFMDKLLSFNGIGRSIVRSNASKTLAKKTGGHYPAPPSALNCCIKGLEQGLSRGLEFEAKELARTLVTPESKALVNLFFLTEESKTIGKSGKSATENLQALVIGAGVMGAGIAGELARKKCQVVLKDTSDEALAKGIGGIRSKLEKKKYLSEAERSFILNRIETTSSDTANMGNSSLVIEAIVERLDVKKSVLSEVAAKLPSDAIIASNTSSLSLTEIAEGIKDPERVVGMHFFNPVDRMPLVEIVRAKQTSDKTVSIIAALTVKLGKFPIVVEDVPGFLVNRILSPYLQEAGCLLAEGFSIETIDKAAKRFGMPMGPIRLLDEVGLDVATHVSEVMVKGYGDRMKGPDFAEKLSAKGYLGKKSGRGFYRFEKGAKDAVAADTYSLLDLKPDSSKSSHEEVQDRLSLRLINEAVQCLDEGVAGAPGREAARQIDLGTVMGTGFPPFRGGVIYYAETLGAEKIVEKLKKYAEKHGERFKVWEGIERRAKDKKSFYEA